MTRQRSADDIERLFGLAMSCDAEIPARVAACLAEQEDPDEAFPRLGFSPAFEPVFIHETTLPDNAIFSSIIDVDGRDILCTTHSVPEKAYLFDREKGFYRATRLGGQTCGACVHGDAIHIMLFSGTIETYDRQLRLRRRLDLHTVFPNLGAISIYNGCALDEDHLMLSIAGARSALAAVPTNGDPEDAMLMDQPFLRESNYVWEKDGRIWTTTCSPYGIASVYREPGEAVARLARVAMLNSFPLNIWAAREYLFVSQKNHITVFDHFLNTVLTLSQRTCPSLFEPTAWPFIAGRPEAAGHRIWIAYRGGSRLCQVDLSTLLPAAGSKDHP